MWPLSAVGRILAGILHSINAPDKWKGAWMKCQNHKIAKVWLHLALGLMIAAEAGFIVVGMRLVMPMCARIVSYADTDHRGLSAFMFGATQLLGMLHLAEDYAAWWAIALAVACGLFEWRMRGQSKASLRLSAMVLTSLLLFAVVAMLTALMVIPTARAAQRLNARHPEPIVAVRMAALDRLVGQLDQALLKQDWPAVHELAHEATGAAEDLAKTGAAASTLLTLNQETRVERLRTQLESMESSMEATWAASRKGDAEQVKSGIQKFHEAYEAVTSEVTRAAR
jgi:hypothetical protein